MNRIRTVLSTTLHMSVFALTACAGGREKPSAESGKLKVALLTPGPISDQSWNGGAYAGLERIRDSLGASISHVQTKTPAEFEENFRQYGAQGYDIVFGHGFEFQDAAKRVGLTTPKRPTSSHRLGLPRRRTSPESASRSRTRRTSPE